MIRVLLSRTFDYRSALRDRMRRQVHQEPLMSLAGLRADWQNESDLSSSSQVWERADVLLVLPDVGVESQPVLDFERERARALGIPVFAIRDPAPDKTLPSAAPFATPADAIQVGLLDHDIDSCERVVDLVLDHLHSNLLQTSRAGLGLATWVRDDLQTLGVAAVADDREVEILARVLDDPHQLLRQRNRALRELDGGEVGPALRTLAEALRLFTGEWSLEYLAGRLRSARGRYGEEREAVKNLDDAFHHVQHQDLGLKGPGQLRQAACLEALQRLDRRLGLPEARHHLEQLMRLSSSLASSGVLDAAAASTLSAHLNLEEVRTAARGGLGADSDGAADRFSGLLRRRPVVAVRLLNSADLDAVRPAWQTTTRRVIESSVTRAVELTGCSAPEVLDVRTADRITSARGFAELVKDRLRQDFIELNGLVDDDRTRPQWRTTARANDVNVHERQQEDLQARIGDLVAEAKAVADSPVISVDVSPTLSSHLQRDHHGLQVVDNLQGRWRTAQDEACHADQNLERTDQQLASLGRRRPNRAEVLRSLGTLGVLAVVEVAVRGQPAGSAFAPWIPLAVALVILLGVNRAWLSPTVRHVVLARRRSRQAETALATAARADALVRFADICDEIGSCERELVDLSQRLAASQASYGFARQLEVSLGARFGLPVDMSAREVGAAFVARMVAFNEAFAPWPELWWDKLKPMETASYGDLIVLEEGFDGQGSSSAGRCLSGGLLAGRPGPRLVRVITRAPQLEVSDVWTLFPVTAPPPSEAESDLRTLVAGSR